MNWEQYIDTRGDFNIALYLFRSINYLMKSALDLGTMVSTDEVKLRAYKEQVKMIFKNKWLEIASALESYDIIVPCGCLVSEYCNQCGGARFLLNNAISPDHLREISVITSNIADPKLATKLEEGLHKAIAETERRRIV